MSKGWGLRRRKRADAWCCADAEASVRTAFPKCRGRRHTLESEARTVPVVPDKGCNSGTMGCGASLGAHCWSHGIVSKWKAEAPQHMVRTHWPHNSDQDAPTFSVHIKPGGVKNIGMEVNGKTQAGAVQRALSGTPNSARKVASMPLLMLR